MESQSETDWPPSAAVRDAIVGSCSMKAPTDDGIALRMKRVGPPMKTMSARMTASTMLMFDSHWMPRSTPDTADATNAAVRIAMMRTRIGEVTSERIPADSMPPPICSAPRPSEQAEPNSVARIARMLMRRPPAPLTARSPNSGVNIAANVCARPSRNAP